GAILPAQAEFPPVAEEVTVSGVWMRRARLAARSFLCAIMAAALVPPLGATARVARPRLDSLEYRRSWGLHAIGAEAAYEAGYTDVCSFCAEYHGRDLDYAVDHRARIIILPVQAKRPMGPDVEAAVTRVVQSGAVLVVAAGNRKQPDPAFPASYAADPRFARS